MCARCIGDISHAVNVATTSSNGAYPQNLDQADRMTRAAILNVATDIEGHIPTTTHDPLVKRALKHFMQDSKTATVPQESASSSSSSSSSSATTSSIPVPEQAPAGQGIPANVGVPSGNAQAPQQKSSRRRRRTAARNGQPTTTSPPGPVPQAAAGRTNSANVAVPVQAPQVVPNAERSSGARAPSVPSRRQRRNARTPRLAGTHRSDSVPARVGVAVHTAGSGLSASSARSTEVSVVAGSCPTCHQALDGTICPECRPYVRTDPKARLDCPLAVSLHLGPAQRQQTLEKLRSLIPGLSVLWKESNRFVPHPVSAGIRKLVYTGFGAVGNVYEVAGSHRKHTVAWTNLQMKCDNDFFNSLEEDHPYHLCNCPPTLANGCANPTHDSCQCPIGACPHMVRFHTLLLTDVAYYLTAADWTAFADNLTNDQVVYATWHTYPDNCALEEFGEFKVQTVMDAVSVTPLASGIHQSGPVYAHRNFDSVHNDVDRRILIKNDYAVGSFNVCRMIKAPDGAYATGRRSLGDQGNVVHTESVFQTVPRSVTQPAVIAVPPALISDLTAQIALSHSHSGSFPEPPQIEGFLATIRLREEWSRVDKKLWDTWVPAAMVLATQAHFANQSVASAGLFGRMWRALVRMFYDVKYFLFGPTMSGATTFLLGSAVGMVLLYFRHRLKPFNLMRTFWSPLVETLLPRIGVPALLIGIVEAIVDLVKHDWLNALMRVPFHWLLSKLPLWLAVPVHYGVNLLVDHLNGKPVVQYGVLSCVSHGEAYAWLQSKLESISIGLFASLLLNRARRTTSRVLDPVLESFHGVSRAADTIWSVASSTGLPEKCRHMVSTAESCLSSCGQRCLSCSQGIITERVIPRLKCWQTVLHTSGLACEPRSPTMS